MTELEALKKAYPTLQYEDGQLFFPEQEKPFVNKEDTKALITEHYDGREITYPHPSGNPELETFVEVEGWQYVYEKFNNDFEKAFNEA